MSKESEEKSMNLANVKIKEEQSAKDRRVKLNILNEGSDGTIFDLLKLPELDAKGINAK
ncbi:MAG: hypothetical protein NC247_05040 [Ruminococcus flavefaciens]|nr:hypothetical protein [Ruminococcus flavefaciens]MCM1361022.1 hypothetical protein [Clostridiales bacterium]